MLDTSPTTDLQAYDLYLQAHALSTALSDGPAFFASGKRAMALLEQALTRDPKFVLAYCELARWHDDFYFQSKIGPPQELAIDHRGLAEAALEKARRLQPDAGAVHLELAVHALKINNNLEEAEIQVQLARRTLPNNAQVRSARWASCSPPAGGGGIAQVTYGDLRLNPLWDPLRSDPLFEALIQRLTPAASK